MHGLSALLPKEEDDDKEGDPSADDDSTGKRVLF
jgi:hypothetical protein